jgi:hypothetical protein
VPSQIGPLLLVFGCHSSCSQILLSCIYRRVRPYIGQTARVRRHDPVPGL